MKKKPKGLTALKNQKEIVESMFNAMGVTPVYVGEMEVLDPPEPAKKPKRKQKRKR